MPFTLRDMLELGRSKSWTQALKTISGDVRMNAKPLLNYFEKLYIWLKDDNDRHRRLRGWKTPGGLITSDKLISVFNHCGHK